MGPENRFIKRVHDRLDPAVYREKMHNVYRGGTPDVWYSGNMADMWVEYKWAKNLKKPPGLSELQKRWLRDRFAEGRGVAVVVGHPNGAAIYTSPDQWNFNEPVIMCADPGGVATFIRNRCA